MKVTQSCLTLFDPTDYTVLGILQARILECGAFPFPRGSSQPRDWTQISRIAGRFFTSWATREALFLKSRFQMNYLYWVSCTYSWKIRCKSSKEIPEENLWKETCLAWAMSVLFIVFCFLRGSLKALFFPLPFNNCPKEWGEQRNSFFVLLFW